MRGIIIRSIGVLAAILLFASPGAFASTWTVGPNVWSDGSTLAGTFAYDVFGFSGFDLEYVDGSTGFVTVIDASTILADVSSLTTLKIFIDDGGSNCVFEACELSIDFGATIAEGGGTAIALVSSMAMLGAEVFPHADFAEPFVVTEAVVPVPAALLLFSSALGLLGWLRRR